MIARAESKLLQCYTAFHSALFVKILSPKKCRIYLLLSPKKCNFAADLCPKKCNVMVVLCPKKCEYGKKGISRAVGLEAKERA